MWLIVFGELSALITETGETQGHVAFEIRAEDI